MHVTSLLENILYTVDKKTLNVRNTHTTTNNIIIVHEINYCCE